VNPPSLGEQEGIDSQKTPSSNRLPGSKQATKKKKDSSESG